MPEDASSAPKRKMENDGEKATKRARTEIVNVSQADSSKAVVESKPGAPARTSGLFAPTMLLSGHAAAVNSCKFDPSGQFLASASYDRHVFLWTVYGECDNFMDLKGHQNAIQDLHWSSDSTKLYTASADKTIMVWDAEVGERIKKCVGHISFVNSCCPAREGEPLIVSGADDGTTKLWDERVKKCVKTFKNTFQITSVQFSADGKQIFSGSLDNNIKVWDVRRGTDEVLYTLKGHTNTITGLSLSPDGDFLLSNAMDNTLKSWDVRPFCAGERLVKTFEGHEHNYEQLLLKCSWSPNGKQVSAGSTDNMVYVWDYDSRAIQYRLPGHKGSVCEIDFHPTEPIISSCSVDKKIYLGELTK